MRYWRSLLAIAMVAVFGTASLGAVLLAFLLATGPGHFVLEQMIRSMSGGRLAVSGLRGDLPDKLHADTLEVSDASGVWLKVEKLSLDWSALSLFNNRVVVRHATAAKVEIFRRPQFEESTGTSPEVEVGAFAIPQIEIANEVLGRTAYLRAQGSLNYFSRSRFGGNLLVTRLNAHGIYRVNGAYALGAASGTASIAEGADGILSAALEMPNVGPVQLNAQATGTRVANRIAFRLAAGALRASGSGTISLDGRHADVDFAASAPAMRPRIDFAWRSLALSGHVHGTFAAPRVSASLRILDAQLAGSRIAQFSARLTGEGGVLDLTGTTAGVRIPGPQPGVFAGTPIAIEAHTNLGDASWPVSFSLSHPLVAIRGIARTHNILHVSSTIIVRDLAPFAALADDDMRGSATFALDATRSAGRDTIALNARLKLYGTSLTARVLGHDAAIALNATTDGNELLGSTTAVQGAGLIAHVSGSYRAKRLNYSVAMSTPDLARFADTLSGTAAFSGSITGPIESALVTGSGTAMMASKGHARQRIGFDLRASGFPDASSAQIRAHGSLDGFPISITGDLVARGADRNAKFAASWKSLRATGDVALPRAAPISGRAKLELARMVDLAPFIGLKIAGSASATVELRARGRQSIAAVNARSADIAIFGATVGAASVDGAVGDPFGKPMVALAVKARNFRTEGLSGNANAQLDGPLDRLAVVLKSDLVDSAGKPVGIAAATVVDVQKRRFVLGRLDARWREQTLTLSSPATVDFARGIALDGFVAAIGSGDLRISGRMIPALAASVKAEHIPANAVAGFLSMAPAEGTLSGAAQLSGRLDAPGGTFEVHGSGVRVPDYTGKAIAAADLDAHGTLKGRTVALQATVAAGKSIRLALSGEAPWRPNESMNLHLTGTADLSDVESLFAALGGTARPDFLPPISASGTVSLAAQLGGTPVSPKGSITIQGHGLRAVEYATNALPPADLDVSGTLHGRAVTLDATLAAGKSNRLSLSGEFPLRSGESMNLKLAGATDLAVLDPLLVANGRRMRGLLVVDMAIAGPTAAPRARGSITLSNGELQDFARSVRIENINARLDADGTRMQIAKFTAHAGRGTIGASGSIDLGAPGIPVDIAIEARDARPVESDLITATFSGDVKMSGKLEEQTSLTGKISISRGEINLPDRFPPQVAVLDVRRRGQAPPAPGFAAHASTLDLTVSVPGRIFVRGRGMNADLDGHVRVTGTSISPMVSGHFDLERGTLSVGGQTLQFTTGTVGFDGTSVRNRLDPTLDFVAQTSSGGVTATLTVGGYASAPTITLSSVPQLPQDEVLARLLFNQSVIQLTPLQLAQIAQGISALGGIGAGFDPVGMVRKGLGLDRLTFGSVSTGAPGSPPQSTLEAGKSITRKLYLGARQTFSGGTQLLLQYDITRRLKAQATASTINNSVVNQGTAAQDQGSGVGLSYQFEY